MTIEMYNSGGAAPRAATATVSTEVDHGEHGYCSALITFTNGLDQSVTFTTQGRAKGDDTWQTVASDVVGSGSVGSRSVTVPWGLLRISALPGGVPTSGTIQARITRVRG